MVLALPVPSPLNILIPYKSEDASEISPNLIISADAELNMLSLCVLESISKLVVSNLNVSVLISIPLVLSNLT